MMAEYMKGTKPMQLAQMFKLERQKVYQLVQKFKEFLETRVNRV